MNKRANDVQALLLSLKDALQEAKLWTAMPPSEQAMASTAPFCIDTMELSDWLQWIFLPRMQALLDAQQDLPTACGIAPLLEEWGKTKAIDSVHLAALMQILQQLDETLAEG